MIFRWAAGDIDTRSMLKFRESDLHNFLVLLKSSILSFQTQFPDARFCLFFNGTNFARFSRAFEASRPSLAKPVEIFSTFEFRNELPFVPPSGVWWKWVPFRLDITETEIHVDSDILCLGKPHGLIDALKDHTKFVVSADVCGTMSRWVVGNLWTWKEFLLNDRVPINAGLVAFKPFTDISRHFFHAATYVEFDSTWQAEHIDRHKDTTGPACATDPEDQMRRNTNFIDEQGVLNVAIYESDMPFSILPRETNIYGHEVFDRLKNNIPIELCHFISGTKSVFYDIEAFLFRRLYDKNYSIEYLYHDLLKARTKMVRPQDSVLFGLPPLEDVEAAPPALWSNPYHFSMTPENIYGQLDAT